MIYWSDQFAVGVILGFGVDKDDSRARSWVSRFLNLSGNGNLSSEVPLTLLEKIRLNHIVDAIDKGIIDHPSVAVKKILDRKMAEETAEENLGESARKNPTKSDPVQR